MQRIVHVQCFDPSGKSGTEWWEIHNRVKWLWFFHRWKPLLEHSPSGRVMGTKKFNSLEEALKYSQAGKINIGVCSTVVWSSPKEL